MISRDPISIGLTAVLLCALTGLASAQTPEPTTPLLPPLGPPRPFQLPNVQQEALPNGLKIVLLEDHRQPALWLELAMPAGSVRDPHDRVGLAQMTAALLDKGTPTHNEAQIADMIDGLGASLSAAAGSDFLTVSASGLSPYAETLFGLMTDITQHPTFPAEELERARTRVLNDITSNLSDPGTLMGAALDRRIYGDHPYGNYAEGTSTTVKAITRADLQRFHDAYFSPSGATLFVVGDITRAQALALAKTAFGDWAGKEVPAAPAPPTGSPASENRPQIVLIDRSGSEQSQIGIGTLTTGYSDPQRIPAYVATTILGGGGGFENRLMKEIRVKRGLTYGVGSYISRHKQAGAFVISTFTKNVSTGEVISLALKEAERMTAEKVGDPELADRKTYLTGEFALSVATPDGVLTRLVPAVLFGGGPDDLTTYTDKINAATPDQIQAVMTSLGLSHPEVVVVGDAKAVQSQIAPLGDVTVVPYDSVDLLSPTLRSATTVTTQGDAEGRARLAAAITAFGGDAFLNLTSVQIKGKGEFTPPGRQTTTMLPIEALTLTLVAPEKVRLDMTTGFGEITLSIPGAGQTPWLRLTGSVRDAPAGIVVIAGAINPTHLLRDAEQKGYAVSALPAPADGKQETSTDGKPLTGFSITDAQGKTTKIYSEQASGLVRRIVVPGGAQEIVVSLGDYHDTGGVHLPGSLKAVQGDTTLFNLTFDTISVNSAIEASLFARPQ